MPTQEVFDAVLVRPVLQGCAEDAHLVHVSWRAPQLGSRLVQVYVDAELVTATRTAEERSVVLHVDRRKPRLIELLAVDPAVDDPGRACPQALSSSGRVVRCVRVNVPRQESLPIDAVLHVLVDGEAYVHAPLWSRYDGRGGLGGVLGNGALGVDGDACPGLGRGMLAMGPVGIDGVAWSVVLRDLPEGEHTLTIRATTASGDLLLPPIEQLIEITPVDAEPGPMAINSNFIRTW